METHSCDRISDINDYVAEDEKIQYSPPMLYTLCAVIMFAGDIPIPIAQFSDAVKMHFAQWDANRDGAISQAEIDALLVKPEIRWDEAAAVGTMKACMSDREYKLPRLTARYFEEVADWSRKRAASAGKQIEEMDFGDVPNWQATYMACQRQIRKSNSELFPTGVPRITSLSQGALGDCYFLAVIGGAAARDGEQLQKMVTKLPDGRYRVGFYDKQSVEVAAPTDCELAISSTAGIEGIWLPLFEKAFGALWQQFFPENHKEKFGTDAIAKGGTLDTTIRIITGHDSDLTIFRTFGYENAQGIRPTSPTGSPGGLASAARQTLQRAFAQKKLVMTFTSLEKQPPGISGGHAYAVLAFDPKSDMVTLWNPHGDDFKPAGPASMRNGYPKSNGVFSVPMLDFVVVFACLEIENDSTAKTMGVRKGTPAQRR